MEQEEVIPRQILTPVRSQVARPVGKPQIINSRASKQREWIWFYCKVIGYFAILFFFLNLNAQIVGSLASADLSCNISFSGERYVSNLFTIGVEIIDKVINFFVSSFVGIVLLGVAILIFFIKKNWAWFEMK